MIRPAEDDHPRRRFEDDDRDYSDDRGGSPLPWMLAGGAVLAFLLMAGLAMFLYMTRQSERAARMEAQAMADARARSATPAPAIQGGTTIPPGGPAPPRIPLAADTSSVAAVSFGGTEAGHTAVLSPHPAGPGYLVEVFRTRTGEPRGQLSLPNTPINGLAVSPDGKWLAVLGTADSEKSPITAWSVETGQKVGELPPVPKGSTSRNRPEPVWVQFLAADRALVVNSAGGYDVYRVPGFNRVNSRAGSLARNGPAVNEFTRTPANFAVTPDGMALALFDGTRFAVVNPNTGTLVGQTPPLLGPKETVTFWGTALSADGTRLACFREVSGENKGRAVQVWDVPTGKLVTERPVEAMVSAAGMSWWGSDHLALWQGGLGSADVFGVTAGEGVGKVQVRAGKFGPLGPGDRLWAVVSDTNSGPGSAALVSADPPDPYPADKVLELTADGLRPR